MNTPFTLLHGDCLDLLGDLEPGSIDMALCDLPYGVTDCKWDVVIPPDRLWPLLKRAVKDDGAILLFGAEPFASVMRTSNPAMYRYDWVWQKTVASNFACCNRQPLRKHEMVSVFYSRQPTYNPQMEAGEPYDDVRKATVRKQAIGVRDNNSLRKTPIHNGGTRYPSSVQRFSNKNNGRSHPTEKPVDLLEYLVHTYTDEGDTVLDPTMGSGSTGVACANIGRRFVGIEKDAHWFEVAGERIAASTA